VRANVKIMSEFSLRPARPRRHRDALL